MAKKDSLEQAVYFNTLQNLTQELLQRSDDPQIQRLAEELQATLKKARGPITRETAVTEAVAAVRQVRPAQRRLQESLKVYQEKGLYRAAYQKPPGKPQVKRPGPLLVCPVTSCYYQQFFMEKGERYICPEHDLELIPKPKRIRRRRK
jgi:hypothetical protein